MKKSHVYGPVPSRRLGLSLGVDIIPFKVCTLDCIYCQLGPTTNKITEIKDYFSEKEIISQIKKRIDSASRIDYITFSGSGEPTLNAKIGLLIKKNKKVHRHTGSCADKQHSAYQKESQRIIERSRPGRALSGCRHPGCF